MIFNEEFTRKTLPYLKLEYFKERSEKLVFELVKNYIEKYNKEPSKTALLVDLNNLTNIDETAFTSSQELINSFIDERFELQWLLDGTEKFCQDRALYNALYDSVGILEDKTGKKQRGAIPELLTNALGVSFDTNIGHDYLEDAEARYNFYHNPVNKIPFDVEMLDRITNGGQNRKTLSLFMGGVGFGKTMLLCNLAARNLERGLKVLYITLEMEDQEIAKRIDANLLDCPLSDIIDLTKSAYDQRIARIKSKTVGKLIIKEYPTAAAGAAHFRHLLHELKIKKNFEPDVMYIDYIGICCSSRVKLTANIGMYQYNKFIAEEIRGLAVERNLPIRSATQTNREGFTDSDPGMEHTSESFGVPATIDLQIAIISSKDLAEMNQMMMKQIKNRFGDVYINSRFAIGVDREKQRIYDIEQRQEKAEAALEKTRTFSQFNEKFKNFK